MQTRLRVLELSERPRCHDHDYHQLVIASEGSAEFEISGHGGKVDYTRGCLVPCSDSHEYRGLEHNEHLVLDIPDKLLTESGHSGLRKLFEKPRYFCADANLRLLLLFMFRESQRLQSRRDLGQPLLDQLTCTFLVSLHDRLFREFRRTGPGRGRAFSMERLEKHIDNSLADHISVDELAGMVCMSRSHFHDVFRIQTGQTPYQFVMNRRLDRARELLRESDLAVSDVAAQVGFTSQSALTNAFSKHLGTTPGQIRRSAANLAG